MPLVTYSGLSAITLPKSRFYSQPSALEVQGTSDSRSDNILDELKQRGLVSQVSQPESFLRTKLNGNDKIKLYCGVDRSHSSVTSFGKSSSTNGFITLLRKRSRHCHCDRWSYRESWGPKW